MTMETHNPADLPRAGFFKTRIVRGGPWVGARIYETLCCCTINGGDENVEHKWQDNCDRYPRPRLSAEMDGRPSSVNRVWGVSTEIEESEYHYLVDSAAWDRENDPDSPYITANKALDINKMKPIGP